MLKKENTLLVDLLQVITVLIITLTAGICIKKGYMSANDTRKHGVM